MIYQADNSHAIAVYVLFARGKSYCELVEGAYSLVGDFLLYYIWLEIKTAAIAFKIRRQILHR